jgi:hypothetical protein
MTWSRFVAILVATAVSFTAAQLFGLNWYVSFAIGVFGYFLTLRSSRTTTKNEPCHARTHPQPMSSRNGGYQPNRAPRICMLLIAALAIIPILGGGGNGSSSDFCLECLCRSSFRLFRELQRHTAVPPLSPSTPRLVLA